MLEREILRFWLISKANDFYFDGLVIGLHVFAPHLAWCSFSASFYDQYSMDWEEKAWKPKQQQIVTRIFFLINCELWLMLFEYLTDIFAVAWDKRNAHKLPRSFIDGIENAMTNVPKSPSEQTKINLIKRISRWVTGLASLFSCSLAILFHREGAFHFIIDM